MYKIYAHCRTPQLHTVHKKKLEMYNFQKFGDHDYVCRDFGDKLEALEYYRNQLCGPMSPLVVSAKEVKDA